VVLEERVQGFERVGVVVDEEDVQAVGAGGAVREWGEALDLRSTLRRLGREQRQADDERRSPELARALDLHRAAVELDQVTDDGQAEAEPAVAACGRALALTKALEDVRQEVGANAGARVAHRNRRL